jgi:hypothetical protein
MKMTSLNVDISGSKSNISFKIIGSGEKLISVNSNLRETKKSCDNSFGQTIKTVCQQTPDPKIKLK